MTILLNLYNIIKSALSLICSKKEEAMKVMCTIWCSCVVSECIVQFTAARETVGHLRLREHGS